MPIEVQGTFVSEKINKVRWIPEEYADPKFFFTGSWDQEINSVKVWSVENLIDDGDTDYPRLLSKYRIEGDVTQIQFLDKNSIVVSSSDGSVRILEISAYDRAAPLKEYKLWDNLHKVGNSPCPCTSLAVFEGEITTVGEDGCINVLKAHTGTISQTIEEADSCSLHCICYTKHNEVITGNLRGHMKIWDLRSPTKKPTASFLLSGDQYAATCVIKHLTQHHMVLAGSEDGSIAIWDLRASTYPSSQLTAHSGPVTEMQFHPETPRRLFTSSATGEIWDWNMDMINSNDMLTWIPNDEKKKLTATSLMSTLHKAINTLDCHKGKILCGTDNEAVYLIKNIIY